METLEMWLARIVTQAETRPRVTRETWVDEDGNAWLCNPDYVDDQERAMVELSVARARFDEKYAGVSL